MRPIAVGDVAIYRVEEIVLKMPRPAHFPAPHAGKLRRRDGAVVFEPLEPSPNR